MDNKAFTELSDKERKIIADEITDLIGELIRTADKHAEELANKLSEIDGEKWKSCSVTTKE